MQFQRMRLPLADIKQVHDVGTGGHGRIRDEPTMTAPPKRFRAHHRERFGARIGEQRGKGVVERGRIGVVGKTAETGVAPLGMSRRFGWLSPTAELLAAPLVRDSGTREIVRQRLPAELGVAARPGVAADVDEPAHAAFPKHGDELLRRPGAVTDGEERYCDGVMMVDRSGPPGP